jgi:hypothetical protein
MEYFLIRTGMLINHPSALKELQRALARFATHLMDERRIV